MVRIGPWGMLGYEAYLNLGNVGLCSMLECGVC